MLPITSKDDAAIPVVEFRKLSDEFFRHNALPTSLTRDGLDFIPSWHGGRGRLPTRTRRRPVHLAQSGAPRDRGSWV